MSQARVGATSAGGGSNTSLSFPLASQRLSRSLSLLSVSLFPSRFSASLSFPPASQLRGGVARTCSFLKIGTSVARCLSCGGEEGRGRLM